LFWDFNILLLDVNIHVVRHFMNGPTKLKDSGDYSILADLALVFVKSCEAVPLVWFTKS
jgi:hypothetical protein